MSAFGSTLNFGLKIGAQDDTQRGISSALSSITAFARTAVKPITIPIRIAQGTLGLMRDINLGLAPVVRAIDATITRGGALEVQQKAFESLTGRSGRRAEYLARRLQDASQGTLRLGEAMALANRAMSTGMGIDQLAVAIEFIGKKAVATGKDARQALDTVITGLIRGSTLFLDDFGILVDGLEGVKRTFDSIHGRGAFEALGPAAQKAETVRQAIEEMRGQMGRLNISGRETVFLYEGIKTQIGDSVDKLVLAVAKSDAMKGALIGVRDTLAGISQHFEDINPATGKKGTFGELFFGKGKSGGIFGLLKAGLMDAGEALGRGMVGGALLAAAEILRFLSPSKIEASAGQKIIDDVNSFKGLDLGPKAINWLGGLIEAGRRWSTGMDAGSSTGPTSHSGKGFWTITATDSASGAGRGLDSPSLHPTEPEGLSLGGLGRRFWKWFAPEYYHLGNGLILTWKQGLSDIFDRLQSPIEGLKKLKTKAFGPISMGLPMNPLLAAASFGGVSALGSSAGLLGTLFGTGPLELADTLEASGRHILSGGVLGGGGRLGKELEAWREVFGGKSTQERFADEALQERLAAFRGQRKLTARGRAMRQGQINLADRATRRIGAQSFREARIAAANEARRLRRAGFEVTPDDQEELRSIFQDQIFTRLGGDDKVAQRRGAAGELANDDALRAALADAAKAQREASNFILKGFNALAKALTGEEVELATIAGKN